MSLVALVVMCFELFRIEPQRILPTAVFLRLRLGDGQPQAGLEKDRCENIRGSMLSNIKRASLLLLVILYLKPFMKSWPTRLDPLPYTHVPLLCTYSAPIYKPTKINVTHVKNLTLRVAVGLLQRIQVPSMLLT